MKTRSKALLAALCAVLLVAASVLGTLAYLTHTTSVVKNTFTVGKVAISIAETDVDEDSSTMENEYKIIPGGEYTKDPTVTVTGGSEDCYVRMFVTVSDVDALIEVFGDSYVVDDVFLLQNLVDWNTAWEYAGYDNGTYEFRYNAKVPHADDDTELPALFTTITIPGDAVTSDNITELDNLKIDIYAHAIQADGFDSADEAWAAWPTN